MKSLFHFLLFLISSLALAAPWPAPEQALSFKNRSAFGPEFDVGSAHEDILTLYRGDRPGLEGQGFISRAFFLQGFDQKLASLAGISSDPSALRYAAGKHQASSQDTPFVSLTLDPQVAQVFAGPSGKVYTIKINKRRVIFNPLNAGEQEVLALGAVFPSEIQGLAGPLSYPQSWKGFEAVWKFKKAYDAQPYEKQKALILDKATGAFEFWHFTQSSTDQRVQADLEAVPLSRILGQASGLVALKAAGKEAQIVYLHSDRVKAYYLIKF